MRRASLVAPLLLIGIGLLFLARNVFPGSATAGLSGQILAAAAGRVGRTAASGDPVLGRHRADAAGARGQQRRMGPGDLPVLCGRKSARRARILLMAAGQPHRAGRPGYLRRELRLSTRRRESLDQSSARDPRKFSRQCPHHRRRCPDRQGDRPFHHSEPRPGLRGPHQSGSAAGAGRRAERNPCPHPAKPGLRQHPTYLGRPGNRGSQGSHH